MTITEELLADLDAKATASDEDIIRSHGWVGFVDDLGLLRKDKAFVTAASPGVVRALIAHIRSLQAAPAECGAPEVVGYLNPVTRFVDEDAGAFASPQPLITLADHQRIVRSLTERLERAEKWVSVDDRLPEPGVTVLACYTNRLGNARRIRAEYVAPKSCVADDLSDPDTQTVEYDDGADCYYLLAGWYEHIDNWDEYESVFVTEGTVTHWMPMPAAPIDAAIAQEKDHE